MTKDSASSDSHSEAPLGDYLTIEEAAALSGYGEQYLRRIARRGWVAGIRRGHFWLVQRQSLLDYLAAAEASQRRDSRYGPRQGGAAMRDP